MKRFIKFLSLAILLCSVFCTCSEEETAQPSKDTTIYGTIFDKTTGEPVRAATVKFVMAHASGISVGGYRTIVSTVTGMDGAYELVFGGYESDITYLSQMIMISCTGYKDNAFGITITPGEGNKYKMDFTIDK
ncbi:MAG: hypothetical protein IJK99_06170 [Bacteroidales bacterium]|nr:hypothetical protein [Bacteroidales bacterium]